MYNASYFQRHLLPRPEVSGRIGDLQLMLGNEKDYVTSRVAHKLGLSGPAISVNTACSTSLVATAMAMASLRARDCDIALAGGVAITCPPNSGHLYQEGAMASVDGHTRPFDASAMGTVFSDGVAIVVLRRLKDAIAAGDTVYAVLLGAAVNNDGSNRASFTAPSPEGQAAVISAAHAAAGIDPRTRFLRRGSRHGDAAGRSDRNRRPHARFPPAYGRPRILRSRLAEEQRRAPRHRRRRGEPDQDFAVAASRGPAALDRIRQAQSADRLRQHAVLRAIQADALAARRISTARGGQLFWFRRHQCACRAGRGASQSRCCAIDPSEPGAHAFGAHGRGARSKRVKGSRNFWRTQRRAARPMPTLRTWRIRCESAAAAFSHRRYVVASSHAQAAELLKSPDTVRAGSRELGADLPEIGFLCPGQGSQYAAMGRGVYETEPAFRAAYDECCTIIERLTGENPRATFFSEDAAVLLPTGVTQPAIFCLEYSLARLWMSWGVEPTTLIGHSVGEFVCAAIAGVMRLEDALALVLERGRRMQALPPGNMLSVRLSAEELHAAIARRRGDRRRECARPLRRLGPARCGGASRKRAGCSGRGGTQAGHLARFPFFDDGPGGRADGAETRRNRAAGAEDSHSVYRHRRVADRVRSAQTLATGPSICVAPCDSGQRLPRCSPIPGDCLSRSARAQRCRHWRNRRRPVERSAIVPWRCHVSAMQRIASARPSQRPSARHGLSALPSIGRDTYLTNSAGAARCPVIHSSVSDTGSTRRQQAQLTCAPVWLRSPALSRKRSKLRLPPAPSPRRRGPRPVARAASPTGRGGLGHRRERRRIRRFPGSSSGWTR